jgi:hypothetical protein
MRFCRIAYNIRLPKIRSAAPSMAASGSTS